MTDKAIEALESYLRKCDFHGERVLSKPMPTDADIHRFKSALTTLRDNQGCAVVTVEEVTFEMFENECSKYRGNMRVMADYLMNAYPNGLRIIPTPPEKGEG